MCVYIRLKDEEKEEAIAVLPETFFVWKFCPMKQPQYIQNGESTLKIKRWHKAKFRYTHRSWIPYNYGFHAFLDEIDILTSGCDIVDIRRFEARRKDVLEIGKFSGAIGNWHNYQRGVVLEWIKPAGSFNKKELLKKKKLGVK